VDGGVLADRFLDGKAIFRRGAVMEETSAVHVLRYIVTGRETGQVMDLVK
jgi:hypothetical protein